MKTKKLFVIAILVAAIGGPVGAFVGKMRVVLIEGQPQRAAHGVDVDELGNGIITEQRL